MGLFDFLKNDDPEEGGFKPEPVQPEDPKPRGEVPMAKPQESDLVRDYITKKYNLADQYKQIGQDDTDLKAAREKANKDKLTANIFEGISTIFAGQKKTDSGFYDSLRNQADAKVGQAEKDREHRLNQFLTTDRLQRTDIERGRADEKYAQERDKAQAMNDPNSTASKTAQELAAKMFPGKDWSKMTAAQWNEQGSSFQKLFDAAQRKQLAAQEAADRAKDREIKAGSIADTRAKDLERKTALDLDKKVNKYSTTIQKSGIPTAVNTLQNIESLLAEHKEGEIPGYGPIEGKMPDLFVGEDGRRLRQETANLFNVVLKDRSGAAVTDNELNRLKDEFGSGGWATEKQLRDGIRRYKERLQDVIRNYNAGTDPKALEKYVDQGGYDYRSLVGAGATESPRSEFVKIKAPDGTVESVKRSSAQKYLDKGGVLVDE